LKSNFCTIGFSDRLAPWVTRFASRSARGRRGMGQEDKGDLNLFHHLAGLQPQAQDSK
jgi:hypothetical protein